MNKALACMAALLGLVATACGDNGSGNSGDTTTTTAASTTTSRPAPTEAEAKAAVLTTSDLPSGWEVDDSTDDGGDDDDNPCPAFDKLDEVKPAAEAEASFAKAETGPFVEHTVEIYADEATAQRVMQLADEAVRACNTFTQTDEDLGSVRGTFALGTNPNLGDQSMAAAMNASAEGVQISGEIVVVRDGRAISVIFNLGMQVQGVRTGRLESALTTELARKAAAKLQAAA